MGALVLPLLIVEDHEEMRRMLERFFQRQRIAIASVSSVAEAQLMLQQRPCRVVITALFSPRDEGLALVRYIHNTYPQTHVVLMSTFCTAADIRKVLDAGAFACLDMPFRLSHLWDVIQRALAHTRGKDRKG